MTKRIWSTSDQPCPSTIRASSSYVSKIPIKAPSERKTNPAPPGLCSTYSSQCASLLSQSKQLTLTFFGRLKVTRVMPGTLVRPSFMINLRDFFSLREWTMAPPAGRPSPSPSTSESESSDPSSSAVTFLVGSSSSISSMRGLDMLGGFCQAKELAGRCWQGQLPIYEYFVCAPCSNEK